MTPAELIKEDEVKEMFEKPMNERIVTVKLTRGELVNLMIGCTSLSQGENREHWKELRDKLSATLNMFDANFKEKK